MDRIDSYIHEAFARFRDVSEIRAQKEEMADHLRDRIRDAIAGGRSDREAFESATAAMSEAMPDLEQTLAEFLRPEFRDGKKPKPHTKEIYINFYRYHRAIMLMVAQILFTLMVLVMLELISHKTHISTDVLESWTVNMGGLIFWFNLVVGIYVVYSIAAYLWNPCRVKRVSVSPWRLLGKFVFGAMMVCIATLIFFATFTLSIDPDFGFQVMLCFLLFYTVFFIIFSTLGWFRQGRYVFAPDSQQDTPLAKTGLILTAVFLVVLTIPLVLYLGHLAHYVYSEREHGGNFGLVRRINDLIENEKNTRERLVYTQNQLNAATGDFMIPPRNATIIADSVAFHPVGDYQVSSGTVAARNKGNRWLKAGTALNIVDAGNIWWRVPGVKGGFRILDSRPDPETQASSMGMGGMGMGVPPSFGMMSGDMTGSGMEMAGGMGMGGMGFEIPEAKEHALSLESDFPATELTDQTICAREFPFEEYKLGMIRAVAPDLVAAGESFPLRIGLGNLDAKNAKLLLTVEYDDGLEQEYIPTGSTLFLGFVGQHEYREYKVDFTARTDGEHAVRLKLRNESGQIIAETEVTVVTPALSQPEPEA